MTLAQLFQEAVGVPPDEARFSAFDGSVAGSAAAPVRIEVATPAALGHLARAPGQLGIARAYVAGDLQVHGDMYQALRTLSAMSLGRLPVGRRLNALRVLARYGTQALRSARRPAEEVRLRGRRHSRGRDAAAISHHYDVSNRFYEIVLGPSMAYTCAVFPRADATLEQAQYEKFDLVARKLALQPGMRLLDVGCGWGGMVMHAAREYGVQAFGVTLSRRQAEWAGKAISEAGLADRARVAHMDYRDVPLEQYDAVSSIGLTEHIGRAELPAYFRTLLDRLRPGGRLLNHCIMRPSTHEDAMARGGFINRYVFPDGELTALGPIVSVMQDTGFEVRHEENLREHYARTLAGWSANLDRGWDEAVAEVGERRARVWRLYMAGSRLGFEQNAIQLHQVLAVRPHPDGTSQFPLRPDW